MFLTFTKKVLSVKRADMRKLVSAAICLLSLSLSVTTGRCIKEARTRTWKASWTAAQEGRCSVAESWIYTGGIVDLSKPQKFDRKDCLHCKFIAMIILHFHLHPQFKYELFHGYFTSEIWYLPRTNAVAAHLHGDTVKSYQNVRSLRGCIWRGVQEQRYRIRVWDKLV